MILLKRNRQIFKLNGKIGLYSRACVGFPIWFSRCLAVPVYSNQKAPRIFNEEEL